MRGAAPFKIHFCLGNVLLELPPKIRKKIFKNMSQDVVKKKHVAAEEKGGISRGYLLTLQLSENFMVIAPSGY